uniref:Uncharacterized protein LOC102805841 n=1 Tax=Saccoglossus kowalevskii TaxID=10224 RepID=A0ABM0M6P7_SACKO|nr:PREDICTED: uncharacterized protein LOC102805841 [Saccoglossus kowalevskii]
MADIFEKEIKDKDDRRELALYLISNNAAVIEQKVLHPHLSKTDKTDRWPLFRELCRSVRIPCCECDDFAISVYHSGLCGDIVRILENDYLMNNYENDKILLDLVGLGLLICTVCSGNISPATEGETKTLRDITTFYLLSNVEKVKQAATMLSQIVEAAEKEKEGTKRRRKKSSKVMHDNDANKEKPDKTTSEVNSRKEPVQRMIQRESIHSNQDNETRKNTDSKPLKVFTQRQVSTVTTKDTRHASNAKIIEASGVVTNQSDVTENNTNTITKVSSNEDNTSENHVQLVRRDSKRHSLLRKLSFSKGKKS